MEHRSLIVRLGGIRALARQLGHPHHTTVQGWHDRNMIPASRWSEVIEASKVIGEPIDVSDLLPSGLGASAEVQA